MVACGIVGNCKMTVQNVKNVWLWWVWYWVHVKCSTQKILSLRSQFCDKDLEDVAYWDLVHR